MPMPFGQPFMDGDMYAQARPGMGLMPWNVYGPESVGDPVFNVPKPQQGNMPHGLLEMLQRIQQAPGMAQRTQGLTTEDIMRMIQEQLRFEQQQVPPWLRMQQRGM